MRSIVLVGPRGIRLEAGVPTSRRERTRGLWGAAGSTGRAMLFRRCRSVHTFGMREAITVAGIDRWFGVRWVRVVPPGRLVRPRRGTRHVLEIAGGVELRPGDRLRVEGAPPERRREEAPAALRRSRRR